MFKLFSTSSNNTSTEDEKINESAQSALLSKVTRYRRRSYPSLTSPPGSPRPNSLDYSRRSSLESASTMCKLSHSSSMLSFSSNASQFSSSNNLFDNWKAEVLFASETDSDQEIRLKVLHYYPLDSSTADPVFETMDGDAITTGFTIDFYDRMYCMWVDHGVLTSFRLQAHGCERTSRRPSLEINGHIIGAPKKTLNRTKSDSYLSICAGHVPQLDLFRRNKDNTYHVLDFNNPGAYPAEIANEPTDVELLQSLQVHEPNITDAKRYGPLICYTQLVTKYCENTVADPKQAYIQAPEPDNKINKHYIQEARTLKALLQLEQHGILTFLSGTNEELIFSYNHNGYTIKANLKSLNPATHLPKATFNNSVELRDYVLTNQITNHHAPLYYKCNNVFLPLMDDAGDNGYHICGDADSEHIGIRADMPCIGFKNFKGDITNPITFIIGLQLLLAQLTCATEVEFIAQRKAIYDANIGNPDCLSPYANIFATDYTKYYQSYTSNEYYANTYVPALKDTLARYEKNPALLREVGQSSIDSLVKLQMFDHPLSLHGPEDLNPKAEPEPFGTTVICYNNNIFVADNEMSYVLFLIHDPKILSTMRFQAHPHWLLSNDRDPFLAKCWLDVLIIQALHEARKGQGDPSKACHYFQTYKSIVLDNMTTKRDPDREAYTLVTNAFDSLAQNLQDFAFSCEFIDRQLVRYNKFYAEFTTKIEQQIAESKQPSVLTAPSIQLM